MGPSRPLRCRSIYEKGAKTERRQQLVNCTPRRLTGSGGWGPVFGFLFGPSLTGRLLPASQTDRQLAG